ncbi:GPI-anchored surface protein, putative [Bodo saltans]|uniref:GPI-anchored surface protein, putative n=1 Tax=Bodo saltans TaxID=75058 RepID=A0A0S4JUN8_BODSA|nr:GPI-anchored surface protein, putative [Bodo saltans]|eukprot:CUG93102.1 GPI-anchored surface protein, putative [Bodo saltans]
MSTISVDDSIFVTRRRVCVVSDVEAGEIHAVKAYFSWLNGLRLSASSSCPLVDVDVIDSAVSWKPTGANTPLFSLAAKGLSRAACKWRDMNHPVAWSQPLSIALPQQQNQIQTPNEAWGWAQQIPGMFPLLPLCGYTCCITGFISSSSSTSAAQDADGYKTKSLITQRLEQLGAHMQPRLDHSVDVLLVPWPDLGEITSERWTAKVHFAIKAGIPVLCAEQFAVIAGSGVQPMEDLVRLYALPRREEIGGNTTVETNDGDGAVTTNLFANEEPLLDDFSSAGPRHPSLVVEPPSANLPDDQLMARELSDEEVFALYTPMWVVLFGMTMAEQQAARRHLSRLHDLQITQQPVLTSTTTHIVVGKAIEAIAPVKGNRDALEHFLTRIHRLPLSRIKTSQWLESLSGLAFTTMHVHSFLAAAATTLALRRSCC